VTIAGCGCLAKRTIDLTFHESRRLTGPGLLLDRPGAALEISLDDPERGAAIARWREAARRMLGALGWGAEQLGVRTYKGGATLAFTAPPDALYAATDLNEWAWTAATAGDHDFAAAADRLRATIAAERNPRLLALRDAARARGVNFLADADVVSAGSGTGVVAWPAEALPDPEAVDWERVHDVPIVLVTGSNGKTTVVRLLAAMAAAGRTAGLTSTDAVQIGSATLDSGDYSGPGGARLLLRHPEVEIAILETARGGLLRRGLEIEHAAAAVVTNIADDHLGEFGIWSLEELAKTKLLVARAVGRSGAVVLNADDAILREAGEKAIGRKGERIAWFSLDSTRPELAAHARSGGRIAMLDHGSMFLGKGDQLTVVLQVDEAPMTLGGAARHNVANALAAMAAADAIGIPPAAMAETLRRFGTATSQNPGRANVYRIGGVVVVIDFAHNPHGMAAMAGMSRELPAQRRLVLLGQAGDRTDHDIRELARAAWTLHPDRVVIKEMERYLRGRKAGEVPALLADEFTRLGAPADAIALPGSELDSVRHALAWARPGDLLLLAVHQDRSQVHALMDTLRTSEWQAGSPVPR
jgi:UDP-N-acetylmuramyl tripeptide synthase